MASECIANFAENFADSVHRKMLDLCGLSARKRKKKIVKYLSKTLGASKFVKIGPFAANVRSDYLFDSLSSLQVGRSGFFFENRPVDVEAWIRALCKHRVAEYHPHRPSASLTDEKDDEKKERVGLIVAGGSSTDLACLDAFWRRLREVASGRFELREFRTEEDCKECARYHQTKGERVMMFSSPWFARDFEKDVAVEVSATYNTTNLDVEKTLGKLWRGQKVAAIGVGKKTFLASFEGCGEPKKTMREGFPFSAFEEMAEKLPLFEERVAWSATMTATRPEDYPTAGTAPLVVVVRSGISSETTTQIMEEMRSGDCGGEGMLRELCELLTDRLVDRLRKTLVRSSTSQVSAASIIQAMRKKTPQRQQQRRQISPVFSSEIKREKRERTPRETKTRNAWLLRDGKEVCVSDVSAHTRMRMRKRKLKVKCSKCPPDRADERKTSETQCENANCRAKFCFSFTGTHFHFKDEEGNGRDVDANLPLFDSRVLLALEQAE